MYNLIVGFTDGVVSADRLLEHTDDAMRHYIVPSDAVDISRLGNLPTLVMPELRDSSSPQVARIGDITDLALAGSSYRFRFVQNSAVPAITSGRIESASRLLDIGRGEFSRHHWAVKNVDLYRVLHESILNSPLEPKVFRLPSEIAAEQDLVAVMMPFDTGFDDVYATLRQAAAESRMRCERADDVWINHHVMDDVINLIWRAQVVIADLQLEKP